MGVALIVVASFASPLARAQDSPLRSVAKSAGLAMDPAPPVGFVLATRPAGEPQPIPVFQPPEEPPSRVKSRAELKAMDANLESAGKKHDAIRAAFPPAAKAMAEAEAEAARKSKRRPSAAVSSSK
jgi:hypothetical protein